MNDPNKYYFDETFIGEISKLLSTSKNICIITHVNPDGDAIGSSLALYNFLLKMKHNVTVITPNQMMKFLKWMQNADKVFSFAEQKESAKNAIENADIIFCLDFNSLSRAGDAAGFIIENKKAIRILIDHHLQPQAFCDFIFSFPKACATAELMFYFIQQLGFSDYIDESIAECLYCGIMTDSGNFRFDCVSAELHELIAALLRRGANQNKIYDLIYNVNSFDLIRLQGYVMSEKMHITEDGKTILISLDNEEQQRFNVGKTDLDYIVNLGLTINGVNLSAFFYENNGIVKAAFRSKGNISVRDIAANYYNGGGHLNASGGTSTKNLLDTVSQFMEILEKNKIT